MKFVSKFAAIAATSVGLSGLGIAAASAAPTPAPHAYTATTHLINRGDGGDSSTWAQDNLWRTVKFVPVQDNIPGQWEYKVSLADKGTFKTNTNVLAPNQHAPFVGVKTGHFAINGTVNGGGSYTVVTNAPIQANKPNLGIPFVESGTPTVNSNETTGNWPVQAFPSAAHVTNSGINPWGWTYNANALTGYHKVTTWNKVFTGWKLEPVTVWKNGHKTVKWEKVAQYKLVPHTTEKPVYKHEQYVDSSATEHGEIAGL